MIIINQRFKHNLPAMIMCMVLPGKRVSLGGYPA